MLVPVAVDEEALRLSGSPPADWQQVAALDSLATQLFAYGVLVLPGPDAVNRLREWATRLPSSRFKKWEAFLQLGASAVVVASEPWAPTIEQGESLDALCSALRGNARVVVLHDDRADLLGFTASEFSRELASIEFVRLTAVSASETFTAAAQPRHLPTGQRRFQFWEQHLEVAVSMVRHLTVVDRYAAVNLVEHLLFEEHGKSGPAWFLQRVADRERPPKVRIYAQMSHPSSDPKESCRESDVREALARLRQRHPRTAAMPLEVCLLDPDAALHDRHLRIGDRVCVSLGNGLGSFNADRARQPFTMARISPDEAHAREQQARDSTLVRI